MYGRPRFGEPDVGISRGVRQERAEAVEVGLHVGDQFRGVGAEIQAEVVRPAAPAADFERLAGEG